LISGNLGGIYVQVESVEPARGLPGVFDIQFTIPEGSPRGDDVPIRLQVVSAAGTQSESNVATMAIELPP